MVSVGLDDVRPNDVLLIASGEVVPVDGTVTSQAVLDESALTGEAAPVNRSPGDPIRSGGVNAGGPFHLRATAVAAESTYAGILRLVREAEQGRAPMLRLADSFALWFVPITIGIAVLAAVVARDPVRAVAVLVVATPCPLILAAPVALVGGLSRAAHRGVIVKNGAALETLGRADIILFDKTGTLTEGRARLADIETDGRTDPDEVLRLAASLDQVSAHALAIPIVHAARERSLVLELPREVSRGPRQRVRASLPGAAWRSDGLASWRATATLPRGQNVCAGGPPTRAWPMSLSVSTAPWSGHWSSRIRSGPMPDVRSSVFELRESSAS